MDKNNSNIKSNFKSNFKSKFIKIFKENIKSKCFIVSIIFLIISTIIFFVEIGNVFKILKSPIQLETYEQAKNLKSGDVVKLDIIMTGGDIIRETSTYSKYGQEISSRESARYYVVPFINSNKSELWYVTVKLDTKNEFDKADKAWTAFKDYSKTKKEPTEVMLSVYGVVKDMNDEEKKYVTTDLTDLMDMIYIGKLNKTRTFVSTVVFFLVIALSIGFIVYYIKDIKKEKAKEMKANSPAI